MFQLHRRGLAAAATAVVTALLATGCSQGSATQQDPAAGSSQGSSQSPVTIRYFTWSAAPDHLKDLGKIVTDFQTANPGITVKVETAPYDQYFTKLQTAIAGGTAPDTFELNYENFVTYQQAGSLLSLDDVAAKDSSYDPSVFAPKSLEAFARDGKQYALPASFSDVVLIYNKKLFQDAGVPLPTSSWTWADEKAAAAKLTNKAKGVFGDYQPPQFFEFYKSLQQTGGSFFGPDGKAAFNDAAGVRAATWLVSKVGTTMPTEADGVGTPDYDTKLFKAGKLAMWHNGIWQFTPLKDVPFDWDVVVEPGDTQKASAVFQQAAAVSATAAHPLEAWKWIRFLGSSDSTVATRLASSWDLPPVSDTSKLKPYLDVTPPANRQAVFDSLDAIALPPVIASQQEMQDAVTKELANAAAGRKSVQQALDDAVAAVNKLLG
jgi:multiple sugar transport system substrate-binding protein